MAAERVHIVHAKNAGAAWSALVAADRNGIRLVTDLPDLPRARMWLAAFYLGALSRGDRVISHSMFNARPMIARHRIPPERVSVIPRSIDLATFNPANVPPERVAMLRQAWGIPFGRAHRAGAGTRRAVERSADAGAGRAHPRRQRHDGRHLRAGRRRPAASPLCAQILEAGAGRRRRCAVPHGRVIIADMPAAYAAADLVVVPYIAAPVYGRVVAEAQAMARPVIAIVGRPAAGKHGDAAAHAG